MKTLRQITLILLSAPLFCMCSNTQTSKNETGTEKPEVKEMHTPMAAFLKWTGAAVKDDNYCIWGGSPILGDDGKIHVFVARWPEKNIDPAWRKSSEVAHYVADSPEGKYVFSDVAVKGSGIEGSWDRYAPHNPEIKKIGDYYAIVFIANSDYHQPPHPSNQKIGLVYSKSLYGPWKKAGNDGMIIEVSKDPKHWTYGSELGVDNPCINEIDGKIVVYFKNRKTVNGEAHAKYGYAVAETIEGPYKMSDRPITDNESYLEDATTFTWNNRYYLITTDNFGTVTGVAGGGILWSSTDWRKFRVEDTELAYNILPYYYTDYCRSKATPIYGPKAKFERPKVLMLDGKPAYLFAPSGWNVKGGDRTVCNILKIDLPE
ncbi:MAG: hypothetical protein GXO47_01825 [Chlorobi bacterium]|nr:hypothetical protein [Chlorobiota bacterium]